MGISPLLSFETSSPVCGVALTDPGSGTLLAQAELRLDKAHASHLLPLAESLLQLAGYQLRDLAAVALSAGPGSYTGLRIGAATAKGLCTSLGVPLLAVSTLRALAWRLRAIRPEPLPPTLTLVPLLDARRQEVFAGVFDADLNELTPEGHQELTADAFAPWLERGPVLFGGSGAAKVQLVLAAHPHAQFLTEVPASAEAVGALAAHQFRAGLFADVAYFEPAYLKEVHTTTPKRAVL